MSLPSFTLKFTSNWNHKLDCDCFTSLRLYNPSMHYAGNRCKLQFKEEERGLATLVDVRPLLIEQINEFIAHLDTGYTAAECKDILRKMYPNANWSTQRIALLLIKKDKPVKPTQTTLV